MKYFFTIVTTLCIATNIIAQVDIKVNVKQYFNAPVIMGYYFNGTMLVKDTVMTDSKGLAHFQQRDKYDEGIYLIYFPDKSYFDIIMGDDQSFEIECDTMPNAPQRVKVKDCKMLADFIDFQNYLGNKQRKFHELSEQYKAAEGNETLRADIKKQYADIDAEVKAKNESIIAANRDNCFGVFLRGLKDVDIPEFTVSATTDAERDSLLQQKRYYYYRNHYFDNLSLTDDRILRTPYFVSKIDKYFDEVLPQFPDTVAAECIRVIEMTKDNEECFRFMTSHLYNHVNNSKIMGMDAALVAIADHYYLAGKCKWAEEKFITDLREQVGKIRYTLVNHKAVDLKKMPSINKGEYFTLSEVDAPFTILVFWEPSCGHCKKEIPALKTQVWDKYASKGIKIFAVYCQGEYEPWKEFVEEHQLEEWINVYDPYRRTNFRTYYNINSTPQIFILDKDKTIIAKRISVDQIGGFLDFQFSNNK